MPLAMSLRWLAALLHRLRLALLYSWLLLLLLVVLLPQLLLLIRYLVKQRRLEEVTLRSRRLRKPKGPLQDRELELRLTSPSAPKAISESS